jgi:hypothetical protein
MLAWVQTSHGDDAEEPRSPAAKAATAKYQLAVKAAKDEYNQKLRAALEKYQQELDAALQTVMKAGNLPEANRINALKTAVAGGPDAAGLAASSRVFLSDMDESDVVVADGWWGKKGTARGPVKIAVDGVRAYNGLCTHPATNSFAHVCYALEGKFERFNTGVALNDTSLNEGRTPVTFIVNGDGKELWRSSPVKKWKSIQNCRISVRGVRVLELRVECPGDYMMAHAVWIDPVVSK